MIIDEGQLEILGRGSDGADAFAGRLDHHPMIEAASESIFRGGELAMVGLWIAALVAIRPETQLAAGHALACPGTRPFRRRDDAAGPVQQDQYPAIHAVRF